MFEKYLNEVQIKGLSIKMSEFTVKRAKNLNKNPLRTKYYVDLIV